MSDNRIQQWLADLQLKDPTQAQLVETVRTQILALGEDIGEEMKYGGILFGAEQHFCGLFAYSQHISLEFGEGAALPDTHKVLEGKGKFRRHIKLISSDDITRKHVLHYLQLALQAARQTG